MERLSPLSGLVIKRAVSCLIPHRMRVSKTIVIISCICITSIFIFSHLTVSGIQWPNSAPLPVSALTQTHTVNKTESITGISRQHKDTSHKPEITIHQEQALHINKTESSAVMGRQRKVSSHERDTTLHQEQGPNINEADTTSAMNKILRNESSEITQQREDRSIILLYNWSNYVADPKIIPNKQITCLGKYFCSLKVTSLLSPDNGSDIAVFHERGLLQTPPLKHNGQLWVFRTGEPQNSLSIDHMENWNGYFNYSIDHMADATFRTYVREYRWIDKITFRNFSAEKFGRPSPNALEPTALWFVSNCATDGPFKVGSARAEYAFELSKFINISVHSKKNSQCRRNQFLKHLIKDEVLEPQFSDFSFYLSFENLLCKNYITEKLWKILTGKNLIIPIVMGGLSSEEYKSIAPPNSYIDVRNFTSPLHLAAHLKFVTNNAKAFNYYQQWRNEYTFHFKSDEPPTDPFCRYCRWAWEKPSSIFSNMGDHFNKNQCKDLSEPKQHCPYYNLDCASSGKESDTGDKSLT